MTGLPYPIAFFLGLVGAILLGFIVERTLINRFCRAPRLVLTVATIGIAQLLTALALFMPGWFGFKNLERPTLNPPFDVRVEIGGVFFDDNDLMVFIVVPLVLARLGALLALRQSRHRDPGRGRTGRSCVDARYPGRARADHRLGPHDRARLRHGVPARRRRRLPDRQRARRGRARTRARRRRDRTHGELPAHRRRRHRPRHRRVRDRVRDRPGSLRVPDPLRDHRRRPGVEPEAARQSRRRRLGLVLAGRPRGSPDPDRAEAPPGGSHRQLRALRRDRACSSSRFRCGCRTASS